MSKSNGSNAEEKKQATQAETVKLFSTPGEGETLPEMFKVASQAFTVGVHTFAAVPVRRKMTLADVTDQHLMQLEYIMAGQAVSGSETFPDAYDAASPQYDKDGQLVTSVPYRSTLLQDAADNIVVRLLVSQGVTNTKRADRVPYVDAMLNTTDPTTITRAKAALQKEIVSILNETKAKKGSATATPTAKVSVADLFASLS